MSTNEQSDKYSALGARLKFLREQWQQSLHDVCSTLEIDETTLKQYESGNMAPTGEVLDMLISHFLLTEDQAQDLRELAGDQATETNSVDGQIPVSLEESLAKQLVMFMPIENRIVYTDSMQATVNDNGVVLQFMQQTGNNGQNVPIGRVGMSRHHAERVIEVLTNTLKHHDQKAKKNDTSESDKK